MKPCADKQKLIAWLTLNALEGPAEKELRAHLETCAGCRSYLAELSQVTNRLASVEPDSSLSASESFHRQVMDRVKAQPAVSVGEKLAASLHALLFNWRVLIPTASVVGLMLGLLGWPNTKTDQTFFHPAARVNVPIAAAPASENLAPTIANYQQAADESLDKLDAMLGDEGKSGGSSAPIYTAASRSLSF